MIEAFDEEQNEKVAIKIIKRKTAFMNQALSEIQILEKLNKFDSTDFYSIGMFVFCFLIHIRSFYQPFNFIFSLIE